LAVSLDEELSAFEPCRSDQRGSGGHGLNQTQAAKLLGIPRRTVISKMAALDVTHPRREEG